LPSLKEEERGKKERGEGKDVRDFSYRGRLRVCHSLSWGKEDIGRKEKRGKGSVIFGGEPPPFVFDSEGERGGEKREEEKREEMKVNMYAARMDWSSLMYSCPACSRRQANPKEGRGKKERREKGE